MRTLLKNLKSKGPPFTRSERYMLLEVIPSEMERALGMDKLEEFGGTEDDMDDVEKEIRELVGERNAEIDQDACNADERLAKAKACLQRIDELRE